MGEAGITQEHTVLSLGEEEAGRAGFVVSEDGTAIGYWRTGAGPPLVLVHGTSADHARWAPVLSALGSVSQSTPSTGGGKRGVGTPRITPSSGR